MADPLADLRRIVGGALDAELKKLADQAAEILKVHAELKRYLKMAEDAKKPSAYPAELVGFFTKAGFKVGDKDGDQKKNVQLLKDKLQSLEEQQLKQQMELQATAQKVQQMVDVISDQLKEIGKSHEAAMRRF